ncbi:MAG: Beta-galactosidase C-terminal domain, partial [Eubacterium sp.]|nr:Beta-galactosidase C-terminal domain [Eubacterium sp.]
GVYREYDGSGLVAFFNFSGQQVQVPHPDGKDLLTGSTRTAGWDVLKPYAFAWIRTGKTNE